MIPRLACLAFAAVLALPALAPAQNSGEAPPPGAALPQSQWSGDWTGWGDQGSSQWSIDISFLPTGDATIAYASIPCAGVLQLLKDGPAQRVYREKILTDVANCIDGGTVTLTLADGTRLDFAWEGGGTSAAGSLRKIDRP